MSPRHRRSRGRRPGGSADPMAGPNQTSPPQQASLPQQAFSEFCNQRRIGCDGTFLWCCLIVLGEGFARLYASCTAWGVGSLAAFVVCATMTIAWAHRRPDSYAAYRQWVMAFLRITRWTLPLTYAMQLALLGSDSTQFGGGFLGHAVYFTQALIGSGLVGVIHGSLAAPLCLPWQVIVICAELSLVIPRSGPLCSTFMRHAVGAKAAHAAHGALAWLLTPPWASLVTSAAAGGAAGDSSVAGTSGQQPMHISGGVKCDECWVVMVMLLCCLGGVLPLLVHALRECALFRHFAAQQGVGAVPRDAFSSLYHVCMGPGYQPGLRLGVLAVLVHFGLLIPLWDSLRLLSCQ